MADALIDSIDANAPLPEQQLAEVMKYIKEVFAQYPNDDKESDKCRQELLLNKIAAIDPAGKNEKLILFKEMVLSAVKV